ncbi:MAG: hypothetical protein M0D55_14155 [Elusimicrobiota bacterium]|nr:MAG: hypothetical protein M0D55_14155 [Elusimicrobiota bacterium]
MNYMAQAAAKDKEADAAANAAAGGDASAAPTDATAASAAESAAADGKATTPINAGGGAGAVGSMSKGLANVKKLGALSGATGGGASSASASTKVGLGDGLNGGARGSLGGSFGRSGPGAKGMASNARAARGGRGRSGMGDARMAMKDQAGGRAGSSFAAGRTYDGSTAGGGGAIGPDGGAIGMGGVGDGAAAQPKSLSANNAPNVNQQEPPIPVAKKTVSPWSAAIARAQMLVMLAAALAFAASKIPKGPYTVPILWAIGIAITLIGGYIGVLAGQIMSGKHKQNMQAGIVAAASVGVIMTGIGVMIGAGQSENSADATTAGKDGATETKAEVPGKNALNSDAGGAGLMANPMVIIGGGLAIVAGLGLMFAPKPKPIQLEEGEKSLMSDSSAGAIRPVTRSN